MSEIDIRPRRADGDVSSAASEISFITPQFQIHRTDGETDGPVFISVPASRLRALHSLGQLDNPPVSRQQGETSFLITPRARHAATHVITHPIFIDPERSGERLDEVEKVEIFATAGNSTLTLDRDFPLEPTHENYFSREKILERLRRSTFFPAIPEDLTGRTVAARFIREVLEHGRDDVYWDGQGAALARRFDKMAFRTIRNEYGTREPEGFFDNRTTEAYQIIQELIRDKIPEARRTSGVLTRAALISSPSELVRYALTARPRLQYEALRMLNVAEMLAKSDQEREGLKPLVARFFREITNRIFDPEEDHGRTQIEPIYAIFNKETGEPLWDSKTDSILTRGEFSHYQEIGIVRRINWNINTAPIIGGVYTDPRFKDRDATYEKMIREAEHRQRLVDDNFVEPTGVTDLGGIMHVLLDETVINGSKINQFIRAHMDLAREVFGDEVEVRMRDSKTGGAGKSKEHRFRRIDILVPQQGNGKKHKIEIILVPLQEYLKNEYQVGVPNERTGILNGPAHRIYEKIRRTQAAIRMLPESLFGKIDWNKITRDEVELAAAALAKEDQIPFGLLESAGYVEDVPPSPFAEPIALRLENPETSEV